MTDNKHPSRVLVTIPERATVILDGDACEDARTEARRIVTLEPVTARAEAFEDYMNRYRDMLGARNPGIAGDVLDDTTDAMVAFLLRELERLHLAALPASEMGHA